MGKCVSHKRKAQHMTKYELMETKARAPATKMETAGHNQTNLMTAAVLAGFVQ